MRRTDPPTLDTFLRGLRCNIPEIPSVRKRAGPFSTAGNVVFHHVIDLIRLNRGLASLVTPAQPTAQG